MFGVYWSVYDCIVKSISSRTRIISLMIGVYVSATRANTNVLVTSTGSCGTTLSFSNAFGISRVSYSSTSYQFSLGATTAGYYYDMLIEGVIVTASSTSDL